MAKNNKKTKKEEEPDYDLNKAIQELEASELLKTGFEYYVNHNTVNIKDNTTLQKAFKKFKEGA